MFDALVLALALGGCSQPPVPASKTFNGFGWVPCAMEGETCVFSEADSNPVRVVYGDSTDAGGDNVEVAVSDAPSVPCTDATFGGDPAPDAWQGSFCWYWGRVAMSVPVSEPMHPRIDLPMITPAYPGYDEPRVRPGPGPGETNGPVPSDVGAFRELCGFSHFAFDDPIVYPGEPGRAHLHMFFGNTAVDANTTAASAQSSGSSTCVGGTLNRSAYWTPAMIDNVSHQPVRPYSINVYYKSGYQGTAPGNIHAMPEGLVMIAGDATNTTPGGNRTRFMCDDANAVEAVPWQATIPGCPAGGTLMMEIIFPQCWDGVNLDSANHKSHMAYGTGSGCPSTHPVALPEISYNVRFRVGNANATLHWQLASDHYDVEALGAGLSGHADYMYGWDPATVDTFIASCVNASMDCHNYLLGDGTMLY